MHFLGANWCRINQAAALQWPGLVTFGAHLEHSRQDFHKQLGGDGVWWGGGGACTWPMLVLARLAQAGIIVPAKG